MHMLEHSRTCHLSSPQDKLMFSCRLRTHWENCSLLLGRLKAGPVYLR